MVSFTFRGLIPPVLTPFNDDSKRSLNLSIIPEYVKFLAEQGIKAFLVNGTSGEGMSMTVEERKLVTEAWIKAARPLGLLVVIQVGGAPLPDVLELARHAEEQKADALLCLPELYFKPKTPAQLVRYLGFVSKAAPKTPLLYYHIPSMSDVTINMPAFLEESIGKIPTFVGIKFTSKDLDEAAACLKVNDGKYAVFLGADTIMAGAYALGLDSCIATSTNMLSNLSQQILKAVAVEDKIRVGRQLQKDLTAALDVITKNGTWVPTMKVAMGLLTPINVGPPRDPLVALTESQVKQMRIELMNLGYTTK